MARRRATAGVTTRSVSGFIAILVFLISTFHLSNAQFGAVDRRALLQARDTDSISGRYFQPDFSPAWPPLKLGGSGLDARQVEQPISCGQEAHSCNDVGGPSVCCSNKHYCFVMKNWTIGCCSLGNDCRDVSYCSEGDYYVNVTFQVTTTIRATITTGGTTTTSSQQFVDTTSSSGCQGRPCKSKLFLCQPQFGGQCCGYGSECASNGQCISTVATSSTPLVTAIPPECTAATQFACIPGNKTAGCCASGQTCVGDRFCSGVPLPTGTDLSIETSSELSSQAKAGIGAGVAIGAAILIGVITWFCIRRQRDRKEASRRASTAAGSGLPPGGPAGFRMTRDSRGLASGTISPDLYSGRHERTMSEISGPTSVGAGNRPPLHQSGLVYDYFGPNAVPGPYTEDAEIPYSAGGPQRRQSRGVPAVPRGPGDISVPVEIGESADTQAQKRPGLLGVYSSVSGVSGGEPASYTTTPDPAESGHHTTTTSKHNTGNQNVTTITTATTAVPSPPLPAMHHTQVHEMDPQREGPYELADMYSPVGHGPLRSYEEEEAAHAAALAREEAERNGGKDKQDRHPMKWEK